MEKEQFPTMNELTKIIRRSLKGKIPEENINIYMSKNFETGAVCFNLQVTYPTMESLCPERAVPVTRTVSCPVLEPI